MECELLITTALLHNVELQLVIDFIASQKNVGSVRKMKHGKRTQLMFGKIFD